MNYNILEDITSNLTYPNNVGFMKSVLTKDDFALAMDLWNIHINIDDVEPYLNIFNPEHAWCNILLDLYDTEIIKYFIKSKKCFKNYFHLLCDKINITADLIEYAIDHHSISIEDILLDTLIEDRIYRYNYGYANYGYVVKKICQIRSFDINIIDPIDNKQIIYFYIKMFGIDDYINRLKKKVPRYKFYGYIYDTLYLNLTIEQYEQLFYCLVDHEMINISCLKIFYSIINIDHEKLNYIIKNTNDCKYTNVRKLRAYIKSNYQTL